MVRRSPMHKQEDAPPSHPGLPKNTAGPGSWASYCSVLRFIHSFAFRPVRSLGRPRLSLFGPSVWSQFSPPPRNAVSESAGACSPIRQEYFLFRHWNPSELPLFLLLCTLELCFQILHSGVEVQTKLNPFSRPVWGRAHLNMPSHDIRPVST
jgi:hypothetical protein